MGFCQKITVMALKGMETLRGLRQTPTFQAKWGLRPLSTQ